VAADPAFAEKLRLADPELFTFTSQSGVIHIEGVSDEKDFEEFIVINILYLSIILLVYPSVHPSSIHSLSLNLKNLPESLHL
jgi:hypothetical protein